MITIERLQIDLNESNLEYLFKGVYYQVDFTTSLTECDYNSLKFYYVDEFSDSIEIRITELEKHGIDEDFKDWLCNEIDKEIRWYYEENYNYDPDENIEEYFERKNYLR